MSVREVTRERLGAALWRRPWLRGALILSPPLMWFLVVYLASLVALLVTAFFSVNSLTGNIAYQWTWSNFSQIFTQSVYGTIILRTVIMAVLVTVTDAVIALPFAFFIAKIASRRSRQAFLALVFLPLWASYSPGCTRGSTSSRTTAYCQVLNRISDFRSRTWRTRTWPCGSFSPTFGFLL